MSEKTSLSVIDEAQPQALELTEQSIEVTKRNIQLCEQLVTEVLEREVDYGTIPGVPQPFLWDAGAAKVMAAFNCYAEYTTVRVIDQPGKMAFTVYSKLRNRKNQQIIATGIGAASTREIKHRYRWVHDPEAEGISRKGLKTRQDGKFRIPNPDTEDLLNTIAKMAAKRADVDAAQSLPGVAATLHKLFHSSAGQGARPRMQGATANPTTPGEDTEAGDKPNWNFFWAKLNILGVSPPEAHQILGVVSIKDDWLGVQGRTLDEAYQVINESTKY